MLISSTAKAKVEQRKKRKENKRIFFNNLGIFI